MAYVSLLKQKNIILKIFLCNLAEYYTSGYGRDSRGPRVGVVGCMSERQWTWNIAYATYFSIFVSKVRRLK